MNSDARFAIVTYGELKDKRTEIMRGQGRSPQQIANTLSALKVWMECHGRTDADQLANDFGENFETLLRKYLLRYSRASQKSRRSLIKSWRQAAARYAATLNLPTDFPNALREAVARAGISYAQLARSAGVRDSSLHDWANGIRRPYRSLAQVARVEVALDLPPDTLKSRVRRRGYAGKKAPSCATAYGRRLISLRSKRYLLTSLPPVPQQEWTQLLDFYTQPYPPLGLKRNGYWSTDAHGICGTARRNLNHVQEILGYCRLPADSADPEARGLGLMPNELSLALLSDAQVIDAFIKFRLVRSGGILHGGIEVAVTFALQLLRPETGFLYQHPEFKSRLPLATAERIDTSEGLANGWFRWCHNNWSRLKDIKREIKRLRTKGNNDSHQSRIVTEPISAILALQHPIYAVFDLLTDMKAVAKMLAEEQSSVAVQAIHNRDLFIATILSIAPIRLKNLVYMTYRPDSTGNLRWNPQKGKWRLTYTPEETKNRKQYEVDLPTTASSVIEDYLFRWRPHLLGGNDNNCHYVLRPSQHGRNGDPLAPITSTSTYSAVRSFTSRFLRDCLGGIGPHTFRDIVATEYVKNVPNGFEVAASVLGDSPATLRAHYAHLAPSDSFEHWTDYCANVQEGWRAERR